jgi:hypothetical protein
MTFPHPVEVFSPNYRGGNCGLVYFSLICIVAEEKEKNKGKY